MTSKAYGPCYIARRYSHTIKMKRTTANSYGAIAQNEYWITTHFLREAEGISKSTLQTESYILIQAFKDTRKPLESEIQTQRTEKDENWKK